MENVSNVSNKSICVVCGNEYSVYHKSRQQYCSTNCRVKGNRDKSKKRFTFLSDEYEKPKIETSITKTENPSWTILAERLNKHKVIKRELQEKRDKLQNKLIALSSKNKEKIIGLLIGAGIGVIGGFVVNSYKGSINSSKDSIKELAIKIPLGAVIAALAVIGGGLGYVFGSLVGNFNVKSRKTVEKIAILNIEIGQIDNSIRLELMNIEDLNNQLEYTHRYSSVVENVKEIVTQSPL